MENQLIAVIVRFPSALPTTNAGIQATICRSTSICFITKKLRFNIHPRKLSRVTSAVKVEQDLFRILFLGIC